MPLVACGEKIWATETFVKKEQDDSKDNPRLSTSRGHSGCCEGQGLCVKGDGQEGKQGRWCGGRGAGEGRGGLGQGLGGGAGERLQRWRMSFRGNSWQALLDGLDLGG